MVLTTLVVALCSAGRACRRADRSAQRRPHRHRRCRVRRHRQLRRARRQDAEHRPPGEGRRAPHRFLRGADLLADAGGAHQRPLSAAVPRSRFRSARLEARPANRGCVRPDARCRNCSRTTAIARHSSASGISATSPSSARTPTGSTTSSASRAGSSTTTSTPTGTASTTCSRTSSRRTPTATSTDLFTERSVKFIEENAGEPFFLEVAYNAAHWPFQVPDHPSVAPDNARFVQPQDDPTSTRQDYVAILERADQGVGQILAALDRRGLTRNTLVIFTNDNGGEWLSRNAPLFHRKESVWEGGIRVPAIIRWPGQIPAGQTSSQVGIVMDLTATILAATGSPVPAEARLDGIEPAADPEGGCAASRADVVLPIYAPGATTARGPAGRLEAAPRWREPIPVQSERRSWRAERPRQPAHGHRPKVVSTDHSVGAGRRCRGEGNRRFAVGSRR